MLFVFDLGIWFDRCPVDCGDYVVVTNARKIKVSGRKDEQLVYRKHSMYPGGLKETPYQTMMDKKPNEVRSFPSGVQTFWNWVCFSL